MATQQVLLTHTTAYEFRSSAYSPTGNNDIRPASVTLVDLTLSSIVDDAAANSDQVDLGVSHPGEFTVNAAIEWFAAVAAGGSVEFWWSPSHASGVGVGNPGHPDGVDGAYTGDGGGTVDESKLQMQFIGALDTTDLVGVQIGYVGTFTPKARYGQLIPINKSGTTLCGTDDIESCVVMEGVVDDIQAAA